MKNTERKRTKKGYTSGAYGDRQIASYNGIEWRNEWELIPDDQKKDLVNWINDEFDIDNMVYNQSLAARSPIVEHLIKEKILPDVEPLSELKDVPKDIPEDKIHFYDGINDAARTFMEAFIHHKEESAISMIYQPTKLRIGFMVNDCEEFHIVKLATLQPVWSPPTQKELASKTQEEILASPHKSDEHLDKMFETTNSHSLGLHWAGILELNTPELSTIINGMQHAVKFKVPRYKIEWVNLKNPRDRQVISYEAVEISEMMYLKIHPTDGNKKAPRVYPEKNQLGYGTYMEK